MWCTGYRASRSRCRGGRSPSASAFRPRSGFFSGCTPPSRPRAWTPSKLCATSSTIVLRADPLTHSSGDTMKVYDAASIRNVALVGHSGSGKTQLASAILADAGAINRFGKVDEGTTVTDYDEEEIARKHTLSASLAYAEWNKQKINLIDTPGIGNFLSEARAALHVADAALVVVDAVAGVMVQTEKVWQAADELGLPRLVVLNRLDRERSSLSRSLA